MKIAYREYRDCKGTRTPAFLKRLINYANTIPVSTAACERGFSKMNIICSPLRSRLTVPHMSSLMFISICGPPVALWEPLLYVKHGWLTADDLQHVPRVLVAAVSLLMSARD